MTLCLVFKNEMNIISRFIIYLGLAILNGYIFNIFNDYFINTEIDALKKYSSLEIIFLVVFVAPTVETFFFQFLLFKLLSEYIKIENQTICILIMSLIFSQLHWYNWLYVLMTFVGGLILNTYYVSTLKSTRYSLVLTIILHATYNLYGLLFVG